MEPLGIDSLETVEMVMAIEEVFEGIFGINTEIETFSCAGEIIDWLEAQLSSERPNKAA
jgi:acyl carrier protein